MSPEPEDWQELHSPTVLVENVVSHQGGGRTRIAYRRRAADERLWSGLNPDEQRAAQELGRVWSYITAGLTARAQQYERLDRGQDSALDISVQLTKAYHQWRMRLKPVERSACIAVLFERMSITEAAKAYGRASGWPRANIGRCLDRWIEVRGWA
jgi:hypothetical protein